MCKKEKKGERGERREEGRGGILEGRKALGRTFDKLWEHIESQYFFIRKSN
jgi:hypothetical protein